MGKLSQLTKLPRENMETEPVGNAVIHESSIHVSFSVTLGNIKVFLSVPASKATSNRSLETRMIVAYRSELLEAINGTGPLTRGKTSLKAILPPRRDELTSNREGEVIERYGTELRVEFGPRFVPGR
jgi:hypothetical protein